MVFLPTTRSRWYVSYKWSQQFGAKKSSPVAVVALYLYLYPRFEVLSFCYTPSCGLSICFITFIAEHCVGRYKFVWALLRKYPGMFSGLLVQHFLKRRPFTQSANQMQNAKV